VEHPENASASERALSGAPSAAELKHITGVQFLNQRKYSEAIGALTEAIQLKSGFAEAYFDRCRADAALKSPLMNFKAIEDCTEAIRLNLKSPDVYYTRAQAYSARSEKDHAIQDYTSALALKPDFALAYYDRAIVYQDQRRFELAFKDYEA